MGKEAPLGSACRLELRWPSGVRLNPVSRLADMPRGTAGGRLAYNDVEGTNPLFGRFRLFQSIFKIFKEGMRMISQPVWRCEDFTFDRVALNVPPGGANATAIERFSMRVLRCCTGDSPEGACFCQLHLLARFRLVVIFDNGARCCTQFERCITFTIPRGVFCGRFGVSGEVSSIAVCPCRYGATARIVANICVFALPERGRCLRDCGSPCGCGCSNDDDEQETPCRGDVVFPYSLGNSCGGNRSVSVSSFCGCRR